MRTSIGLALFLTLIHAAGSIPSIFLDALPNKALESGTSVLRQLFIKNFAPQNFSLLVNRNFTTSPKNVYLINDLLGNVLSADANNVPVVLYDKLDEKFDKFSKFHVEVYFVEHEDELMQYLTTDFDYFGVQRIKMHYLIVLLQAAPRSEVHTIMQKMFAHFLANYIINVNILILRDRRTVRIFTYYPYTAQSCLNTEPELLHRFNVSSIGTDLAQLYPNKLTNLHGCPLLVVTWRIPPYIAYNRTTKRVSGFDAAILKLLAQKLNFTVRIKLNEPNGTIGGQIYENGTMYGAHKILYERRANFTIGCSACSALRSTVLVASEPYHQMQYVIVLRADAQYTPYEVLLFPFSLSVWLVFLLFAVARISLLTFYPHSRLVKYVPSALPRLALALWLFTMFFMRSSYESSVFEFIHNAPQKPLPRTIKSVLDQQYRLITDQSTMRKAEYIPQIYAVTTMPVRQPMEVFDIMLTSDGRVGIFTSKAFLAHYLYKHRDAHHKFLIVEEQVLDNMLCIYFTRYSYLESVFSELLSKMRSFGLFTLFAKEFAVSFLPATTAQSRSHIGKKPAAPAKTLVEFEFVKTALMCLLGMYAVAALIFGMEIMHKAMVSRRGKVLGQKVNK